MTQKLLETRPAMVLAAAVLVSLTMLAAVAGEKLTAEEIASAVSDHTYQGSMSKAGSGFAEYYAPGGTIRGDGYTGKWRTEDGAMCFQYGENAERCFEITINGPSMVMWENGKIDGNGMLIEGNPNEF